MNKLPQLSQKFKICMLCEGYEETEYMKKILDLKVWNNKYAIGLENAEGNGNIPARYQSIYSSDDYDLVLVFCDTDETPNKIYDVIKEKINKIHGTENAADLVIIFANPCTMQIILSHFDDVSLVSHVKGDNKALIKKLTDVKQYRANKKQRDEIFNKIDENSYRLMKERIKKISSDDTILPSTNFDKYINNLESTNDSWISDINENL